MTRLGKTVHTFRNVFCGCSVFAVTLAARDGLSGDLHGSSIDVQGRALEIPDSWEYRQPSG